MCYGRGSGKFETTRRKHAGGRRNAEQGPDSVDRGGAGQGEKSSKKSFSISFTSTLGEKVVVDPRFTITATAALAVKRAFPPTMAFGLWRLPLPSVGTAYGNRQHCGLQAYFQVSLLSSQEGLAGRQVRDLVTGDDGGRFGKANASNVLTFWHLPSPGLNDVTSMLYVH